MMTFEITQSIARPAEQVFAFVSDVRNEPQWHTDVLEAQLTNGSSVAKGSTFALRLKHKRLPEVTVTVAEYDPPRKVVFRSHAGNMEPTVIHTVEPNPAGTRFTRRFEMQSHGLMRVMAPLMVGQFRKRNAEFVANLKRVLERS
jgi:carbon monoxide dehydrogenase subunit G